MCGLTGNVEMPKTHLLTLSKMFIMYNKHVWCSINLLCMIACVTT